MYHVTKNKKLYKKTVHLIPSKIRYKLYEICESILKKSNRSKQKQVYVLRYFNLRLL